MHGLTQPLDEILLRSVIGFIALVVLIRIVPKRNAGHISPNDMLILIVVGSIGADAVTGGSHSIGDLLLMVAIVLVLGFGLDYLEYHVPLFRRMMRHKQSLLMRQGRLLRSNMRRELVTEEEIKAVLRNQGITSFAEVETAVLEADGDISIVRRQASDVERRSAQGTDVS